MSEYMAVYKCQLCGEMQRIPQAVKGSTEDIEHLLAKTIFYQKEFGSRPDLVQLMEKMPHRCKDGSLGVSLFVGFKKAQ
ncbi:MAG: hypothetical protein J6A26_01835 [Oscillospiraceae bacterium]|nr:hypothetical protein [Oscillospiraceae bacterium]